MIHTWALIYSKNRYEREETARKEVFIVESSRKTRMNDSEDKGHAIKQNAKQELGSKSVHQCPSPSPSPRRR